MEQLIEFTVFSGKVVIIFLFIVGLILLIASLIARQKMKPELEVESVNDKLDDLQFMLESAVFDKAQFKAAEKERKKKEKAAEKADKEDKKRIPHIFLLKFDGDVQAKAVEQLRDEITAVLTVFQPGDEVVMCIESPGGTVHGYGLAAAQILRLKNAGLAVTACVDLVAASGGYMMACTANKILAAPFAIVGSIGVIAQVPNFNKLLKKHNVDYEEISSGEYKRTVSVMGEITEKGRAKFLEQITDTHELFKEFVKSKRPQVDLSQVATGEYWFAIRAKELNLIDEIMTSDEYLFSRKTDAKIYSIKYQPKKNLGDKISEIFSQSAERALMKVLSQFTNPPRF